MIKFMGWVVIRASDLEDKNQYIRQLHQQVANLTFEIRDLPDRDEKTGRFMKRDARLKIKPWSKEW